jgi:hypothetical protein
MARSVGAARLCRAQVGTGTILAKRGGPMTTRHTRVEAERPGLAARVRIDHAEAVIVSHPADGSESTEILNRRPTESEARFEARTADEVIDEDRIAVSGPEDLRIGFDRAYVALTHRPERLVDVKPSGAPARTDHRTA